MASFGFETTGKEVVQQFASEVPGKTIAITGASAGGLGAQTAIELASANPAHIVLLARSIGKVQPVIDSIKTVNPSTTVTFVPIGLDKVASVRTAADQVNNQIDKLDILINNAGIMAVPFAKTELGIESQVATNHIGHFLLTKLLMPKILTAGKGARIVNVSSDGHYISPFHFDDPNFGDGANYHPFVAYGQSKTANILFTVSLASKLTDKGILAYSLHPGVIMSTSLANHIDEFDLDDISKVAKENTGQTFTMGQPKTLEQGVSTSLRAALDPTLVDRSGAFLLDTQVLPARDYATSSENAQKLWKWSEKVLGEKFDI